MSNDHRPTVWDRPAEPTVPDLVWYCLPNQGLLAPAGLLNEYQRAARSPALTQSWGPRLVAEAPVRPQERPTEHWAPPAPALASRPPPHRHRQDWTASRARPVALARVMRTLPITPILDVLPPQRTQSRGVMFVVALNVWALVAALAALVWVLS